MALLDGMDLAYHIKGGVSAETDTSHQGLRRAGG